MGSDVALEVAALGREHAADREAAEFQDVRERGVLAGVGADLFGVDVDRAERERSITTPTGDIGSQVLSALLADADEELRVVARDPAKLPAAAREGVDSVTGSHGDADVVDRAFADADAVFWVVPPDTKAASLEDAYCGFTRSAARAFATRGITHVVGVSALGRGTPYADRAGLVTASLAMDDLIAGTGVAYRALANPSFMDNLLRQVDAIRAQHVFTDTSDPDQQAPMVATRDITAAAARLLRDRSWTEFAEVPVLGPENVSPNEMAATMSDVLGISVSYEQQSLADLAAGMRAYGLGEAFVDGMVEMMQAKENGLDDAVARTPQTASPTTFRQWCQDVFKPAVEA